MFTPNLRVSYNKSAMSFRCPSTTYRLRYPDQKGCEHCCVDCVLCSLWIFLLSFTIGSFVLDCLAFMTLILKRAAARVFTHVFRSLLLLLVMFFCIHCIRWMAIFNASSRINFLRNLYTKCVEGWSCASIAQWRFSNTFGRLSSSSVESRSASISTPISFILSTISKNWLR